jgi:hypothetical protein
VPTRYGAGKDEGVRMSMRPVGEGRVAFDPYPFDARPCHLQLTSKRLPTTSYGDVAAFRRAYFMAPMELIGFELV